MRFGYPLKVGDFSAPPAGVLLRAGNEYNWDNAPFEVFSIDLPRSTTLFNDSFE